ncbi:MAG TPA: DnaB-like helicase N-terminal domain-containing protein, partial [Thermodesulfovibrionales bacterium]|nr:DnaB-like helicase N-terminal domain-containing protein [Thermodesulfovibrionales bacterium]
MRDIDSAIDRLPPQSIEAEQSILGAVLLDNDALPKVLEVLSPEDFYRESHRKIFNVMIGLFEKNEAIDLITITDFLKRNNDLDMIGGVTYLSSLVNQVPTAANVRYHSRIVKEKALLRGLLSSATEIAAKVYE